MNTRIVVVLAIVAMVAPPAAALDIKPPPVHLAYVEKKLGSEKESERLWAARELGDAEREEERRPAAELLGSALDDPSAKVRLAALQGLGSVLRYSPIKEEELTDKEKNGEPTKEKRLMDRVLAAAADKDEARQVAALNALGVFHTTQAFAVLRESLRDKRPVIRLAAVRGMNRAGSEHFVAALRKSIEDADPQVQRAAIEALVWRSGKKPECKKAIQSAVKPLIKMLETAKPSLWTTAAWALGSIKAEEAVPILIKALDTPERARTAARLLKHFRTQAAVDALVRGMKSKQVPVRRACAEALRRIGRKYDKQVVGPLIAALKDPDEEVVCHAMIGVGWRRDVGVRVLPTLIEFLKHPSVRMRIRAAAALGTIGDKSAIPVLRPLLKDGERGVRREAGKALQRLGVRGVGPKPKSSKEKAG